VIHLGGRARSLDRRMPAFGDALSDEDIARLVAYLRGFCADTAWPRGNLNLPAPWSPKKRSPRTRHL
jgi:hypothetical protein